MKREYWFLEFLDDCDPEDISWVYERFEADDTNKTSVITAQASHRGWGADYILYDVVDDSVVETQGDFSDNEIDNAVENAKAYFAAEDMTGTSR